MVRVSAWELSSRILELNGQSEVFLQSAKVPHSILQTVQEITTFVQRIKKIFFCMILFFILLNFNIFINFSYFTQLQFLNLYALIHYPLPLQTHEMKHAVLDILYTPLKKATGRHSRADEIVGLNILDIYSCRYMLFLSHKQNLLTSLLIHFTYFIYD